MHTSQGMVQAVAVSCAPDCKALCAVVSPGNLKSAAACRIPASIVVKPLILVWTRFTHYKMAPRKNRGMRLFADEYSMSLS